MLLCVCCQNVAVSDAAAAAGTDSVSRAAKPTSDAGQFTVLSCHELPVD